MKDDLLWVYEGLTNYLGPVLTAAQRPAHTRQESRDDLAVPPPPSIIFPAASGAISRTPPTTRPSCTFSPEAWRSWRRYTEFYEEDSSNLARVDVIIRQQTKGKKTIDDFCHLSMGAPLTGPWSRPTASTT